MGCEGGDGGGVKAEEEGVEGVGEEAGCVEGDKVQGEARYGATAVIEEELRVEGGTP